MSKTGYLCGKSKLCYNKEVTTGDRGNGRGMTIFDTLAERHIQAALESGELEGLAGEGKPLTLDDDSHVPPELRGGLPVAEKCRVSSPGITGPAGGGFTGGIIVRSAAGQHRI